MAQRAIGGRAPAHQESRKSRGHWHRETDVRHRDYSPTLGRFIEREPLGFEAGDNNWYRFVANGPTEKTDPSGFVEDAQQDTIGEVMEYKTGDITVQIAADASFGENLNLPPSNVRPPKINVTVVGSDAKVGHEDRWWISFKKIVEVKTSNGDKKVDVANNPNAPWAKDAGFKNKTSSAFIDTPGGDTEQGFAISRTAYYAVAIVCRSKDGNSVSPLISSFVYTMTVTHDWTGVNKAKSAFKIPGGEFPKNWARLLGVTVDPNLHCDC